ncbi:MAG: hypothetical protein IT269_07445 [Saprospiraceae bacterium]|nr:hypothetical protein [Saprospiraceae bacterium]
MIQLAHTIIEKAFAGKVDRAGKPYVMHLYRVAANFQDDAVLYCIALLHDLAEDCPEYPLSFIYEQFPKRIASAVEALTKGDDEPWDEYIAKVKTNPDAIRVKLADLRDNMTLTRIEHPLTPDDIARIQRYHQAYLHLVVSDK